MYENVQFTLIIGKTCGRVDVPQKSSVNKQNISILEQDITIHLGNIY